MTHFDAGVASLPHCDFTKWRETLLEAVDTSEFACFAVVDPCSHPALPGKLWDLEENPEVWPLYMNTLRSEVALQGPLYVPLTPACGTLLWLTEQAKDRAIGLFCMVERSRLSACFDDMQALLEWTTGKGSRALFRFFDPRVLYALTLFDDQSWAARVAAPAVSLHAWEPGRATSLLLHGEHASTAPPQKNEVLPERLIRHIASQNAAYSVIAELPASEGERLRSIPVSESFPLVDDVCRCLCPHGIMQLRDLSLAVLLALRLNKNIFAAPPIQTALAEKTDTESFFNVVDRLPKELFM